MELSIIIVNYNVRYFLEQCLHSVRHAVRHISAEIRVVDNHSEDDSMDTLPGLFQEVFFYRNTANLGFARANNQALADCRGEFILFLNPDTLLPEDALTLALDFFRNNVSTGAIGMRMLDGRGCFLPESKRAFPNPMVSFWKLTGLAGLFPSSRFFNQYALGHLDSLKNHSVPVLAGACLLARKSILDKLGGFDERFFLYGEDIDLCYRIRGAGYENWYLGEISMLHFKGESSDGLGLTRVRFFYQAMRLFVAKQYTSTGGKLFSFLLRLAITASGLLAAGKRLIKPALLPLVDFLLLYGSWQVFRLIWIEGFRRGRDFGVYPIHFLIFLLASSFLGTAALTGLYDKRFKTPQIIPSLMLGFLVSLAVYSVLPEDLRFSRGVVVGGALLGGLLVVAFRTLMWRIGFAGWKTAAEAEGQTLIAGTVAEYDEVNRLLTLALQQDRILGRVAIDEDGELAVCDWEKLPDFVKMIPVSCVIFCIGKKSLSSIIPCMEKLKREGIRFLFHVIGSQSLVGSHSLASDAEILKPYVIYHLADPYQLRLKRMFDIVLCVFLLLTFPFWLIGYRKPYCFFRNMYQVLIGRKTWVGYAGTGETLPPLPVAVMPYGSSIQAFSQVPPDLYDRYYAKNYNWWQDIRVVFRNPALICG